MIYDNHSEFVGSFCYSLPADYCNTVVQLYDEYETWDVTIKDIIDYNIIWVGSFSEMPLKYAIAKFEGAKVYSDDCEIDIFINESEVIK